MKKIILDRDKKIGLLNALRRGYIERDELQKLFPLDMTIEEINTELETLWERDRETICESLKRRGLCDCKAPNDVITA